MDGWIEFWVSEHVKELRQEVRQARLVRDLKAARRGEYPSPSRRLLGWMAHTGQHCLEVWGTRKPSSGCC